MSKELYCKDCARLNQSTLECTAISTTSLVTGNKIYTDAHIQRRSGLCGEQAKYFLPIEDADLDDLSTIPFGKQPN